MTFHLGLSSESYSLLFLCIDDFNLLDTVLAVLRRLIAEKRRSFTLLSALRINKAYEKGIKPLLYNMYVWLVKDEKHQLLQKFSIASRRIVDTFRSSIASADSFYYLHHLNAGVRSHACYVFFSQPFRAKA